MDNQVHAYFENSNLLPICISTEIIYGKEITYFPDFIRTYIDTGILAVATLSICKKLWTQWIMHNFLTNFQSVTDCFLKFL